MKLKNIIGLVLVSIIVCLFFILISQESTKKVDGSLTQKVETVSNNSKVLSDEERVLEDMKKQAGAKIGQDVTTYYITHCSSCHGKSAEGTKVAPAISGKSYDYIISKLDDYKNNKVPNSLMKGILVNTSQEDLEKLAKEISNFK